MKNRPSPGSPQSPGDGASPPAPRSRLRRAGAIGSAAALVIIVGWGAVASSAPQLQQAEPQPAGGTAALEWKAPPAEAVTASLDDAVPAADKDNLPEAAKEEAPAEQKPEVPGEPAAPIAELKKASTAFEAAAVEMSAPGTPPIPGLPEPAMPNYTEVARGAALGELQARFEEFNHNGWIQTGSVDVVGAEQVEVVLVEGVPTHRVSSCIDSSAVEVRDSSGAVVLAAAPPGTRTAINIYDIQQHEGKWLVVGHSFPDVAAC